MEFRKSERSSQTPLGWRLATVKEAEDNWSSIRDSKIIGERDRVRLLDGWMAGRAYSMDASRPLFRVGYRACIGYMLLVHTSDSDDRNATLYLEVPELSEEGRCAAFLLSCEDWNEEVLHWLLAAHHHPSLRNDDADTSARAVSELVSEIARKWQDVHATSRQKCSWEVLEVSFKDLRVYIKGKWSEALMINYPYLQQRQIIDDILIKELDLTEQRRLSDEMFQGFGPELAETVLDVLVENMALRTFCLLCSVLYDHVVIHSHIPSLADLIHYAYSFLGETTKEGTTSPVKEVNNANLKQFEDHLGFPMSSCKGKCDVLGTCLVRAAENSNTNLVTQLIERGVEVTARDERYGLTALHHAAFARNLEIAEMLLRKNETLANAADYMKRTPLHLAAYIEHNTRICALLVHHKADLVAKDDNGCTPLHNVFGVFSTDENAVFLLSKAEQMKESTRLVDVENKQGRTPLNFAIGFDRCDVSMVAFLLSQSGHPESYFAKLEERRHLSAYLRESSRMGYVELIQKLLDGGADPFEGDSEGKNSLHCAVECVNVVVSERGNFSRLEEADVDMAFQITEKLLFDKKRGSINWENAFKPDKYGRNMFHLAAFLGRKSLCGKLITLDKTVIDSEDRDGQTPVFYAAAGAHDNSQLVKDFFTTMGGIDDYFHSRFHEEEVRSSVCVRDFSQMTPLHVAADRGNINMVRLFLSLFEEGTVHNVKDYVVAADVVGQTALHKAARGGHVQVVKELLENGADPLKERDCDAKTALHFAAQADGEKAVEIAKLLLENCETDKQKSLLLFASPVGKVLPNVELDKYLDGEKRKIEETVGMENLMRVAAIIDNIDMTLECVARGADVALLRDNKWISTLQTEEERNNVQNVVKKIRTIIEQANDKPSREDCLGRSPFAIGLAALFLNPFVKSPINVGISGEWGMGKSSLMLQTESNLLSAAAQFLVAGKSRLSMKGKGNLRKLINAITAEMGDRPHIMQKIGMSIERVKNFTAKVAKIIFERNKKQEMEHPSLKVPSQVKEPHIFAKLHLRFYEFWSLIRALWEESAQLTPDKLSKFNEFLENYESKFREIFKALAIMDRSNVFEEEEHSGSRSEIPWEEYSLQGSTPSILTVQYNAWHYRNETEAWAGLAVEITKELEATMTVAHRLRTSWTYNWIKNKNSIRFEMILPFFLTLMVSIWFTTIVWLVFDTGKGVKKLKYGGIPASIIVAAWGLGKSVHSFVKPISSHVVDYICLPDHSQKLGYHQKVVDDINFLKESLCYKGSLKWEVFAFIWCCITWSWNENNVPGTKIRKMPPTYANKLRMIVFVDDLDRCEENVILQILSAVNLVLATCGINVILSMENNMIKRAILRKYGNNSRKDNEELAEKYLRKIVQLPLHLPDPSDSESTNFLKRQLGMWENSNSTAAYGHVKLNPKFQILTASRQRFPDSEGRKQLILEVEAKLKNTPTSQTECREFEKAGGYGVEEIAPTEVELTEGSGVNEAAEGSGVNEVAEGSGVNEAKIDVVNDSTRGDKEGDEQEREESKWKRRLMDCLRPLLNSCNVQPHEEVAEKTIREDQAAGDEGSKRKHRSFMDDLSSIMSAMLIPKYTPKEQRAFLFLHKRCTRSRKLPREWKCFLTYHRLAWNISYLTFLPEDVIPVEGWQVQLIAWIFVCWEWKDLITILIRKWKKLEVLRNWEGEEGPSLREIVEHYIEEVSRGEMKSSTRKEELSNGEVEIDRSGNLPENVRPTISEDLVTNNLSSMGEEGMEGDDYLKEVLRRMLREQEGMREALKKSLKQQEEMREALEKSMKQQEEMRDMLKRFLKEEGNKEERSNENRTRMIKKYLIEEEEIEGESSVEKYTAAEEVEEWNRLKETLRYYNVSMNGIQAFQKFRFFCEAGHLTWPLPQLDIFSL